MAIRRLSIVLAYSFLSLCFSLAFTSRNGQHGRLKSLHFSLYGREVLNKTIYSIVLGVDTGAPMDKNGAPFGSLFAFQDPLTIDLNSSSEIVGYAEGAAITSSIDGLQSINMAKVTLNLKKHKGSISVLGVTNNVEALDLPVVGGTDDFLFVQGYVTAYRVGGLSLDYKLDFHLYWPPFATYLTSPKSPDSII